MWNSLRKRWMRTITGITAPRARRAIRNRSGLIERLEERQLLSAANGAAAELGRASTEKGTVHIFWNNFFAEFTEGNSGEKTITLQIVASPAPKKDIKVDGMFDVAGVGIGMAGDNDFAVESFSTTIKKGENSTTVQATIFGDILPELNEIFVGIITKVSSGVIDGGDQTVTIVNDDEAIDPELPNVSFVDNGVVTSEEGQTQQFTVALSEISGSNVDVTVALTGTGASIPGDAEFAGGASQLVVTIPAGTLMASFNVSLVDDLLTEQTEGYSVSILSAVGANVVAPTSQDGQITDNDAPPTVAIDEQTNADEGNEGTTTVPVNITLSEAVANDVVVHYSIEVHTEADKPQRAKKKKDFVVMTGTATILAGQTTGTINAQVVGDTKVEENEVFLIRLTSADGAAISEFANAGVVTILNDDGATAQAAGMKSRKH